MARNIEVLLIDDLDGERAEETVSFGLDGTIYEIDLSEDNAVLLRERLALFVENARRTDKGTKSRPSRGTGSGADRDRAQQIRTWARSQGLEVNDRGRIPATIVEQFNAAH